MNSTSAVSLIESRFPSLSEEIHDELSEGLLHCQMGVFSRLAQDFIDEEDKENWSLVTSTFIEIWNSCDAEVTNALNVSFLEHLNFKNGKKKRDWAYGYMPEKMRRAFDEMEAYNRKIHGG